MGLFNLYRLRRYMKEHPNDQWNPSIKSKEFLSPKIAPKTPVEIMEQLVAHLTNRGVGFSNHQLFFTELANQFQSRPTYPPYDILGGKDDKYEIRMALAGFAKKDISITFQDQVLTVSGAQEEDEDTDSYFHKGIAARNFSQAFPLAEYVNIVSAEMADGILTIKLERELPEELKPKTITIK